MDAETAAEFARVREMLDTLSTRADLTAEQVGHVRAAGDEIRGIVIGPGTHALTDRMPRAEARLDALDRTPTAPPVDSLTALWTGILKAVTTPLTAFAAARTGTQALIVVAVVVVVFILFGEPLLRVVFPPPPAP